MRYWIVLFDQRSLIWLPFSLLARVDFSESKLEIELFGARWYRPIFFLHALSPGICASLAAGKSNSLVTQAVGARPVYRRGPVDLHASWTSARRWYAQPG